MKLRVVSINRDGSLSPTGETVDESEIGVEAWEASKSPQDVRRIIRVDEQNGKSKTHDYQP